MSKSKIYNFSPSELQILLNSCNSYKEVLQHVGINSSSSTQTLKRIISEYNLDTSILDNNRKKLLSNNSKSNRFSNYNIYDELHKNSNANSHKLKNRLIKFGLKEEKCECCGNFEWLGKPIKLQLHHIDGDHFNNELSNLQLLCPNCHSMTDNYGVYNSKRYKEKYFCTECGKEIKRNKTGLCKDCYIIFRRKNSNKGEYICPVCKTNYKDVRSRMCIKCFNKSKQKDMTNIISRKELKHLIREMSFTYIGNKYGVTDNSVRKWCKKYNLPTRKTDIDKYDNIQWGSI